MTIQDLFCFMHLAETLNYTKTAEDLFISQPAVTRHINSLEDELGVKLFDRSVKRNITLTEAGVIYYDGLKKCKGIYDDTIEKITSKTMENPFIINFLRGTVIPDEFVEATSQFMATNPSFNHFSNFIDESDFSKALEKGEVIICPKDYKNKYKGCKTMQLTANPVPYYLVAGRNHPGFRDSSYIDFQKIKDTTLFLPKNLPDALKKNYFAQIKSLLGSMPVEIMYLDSMDSVELFLRSGRCFTIAGGWYSALDSKHLLSYKIDISSHYIAMWDPSKCVYPMASDYLKMLKQLEI
ncbi:MAG: LysR family transcriptional regulator [Pseudobutyrivibrio sp.]|nr:LysR family transcriptional regulator [Pseudobutyrivibrio sp.]